MKTGSDIQFCRRRIAELEPRIQAWVEVVSDPEPPCEGPLHGIPFGAKDIYETLGLATEYGSPLYKGRKGDRDADLIVRLRELGAVLLGKTQTTAFASFDPAPTNNPRLPGHTPGGSSSGSAAAVAAGMVPFAIGTQTLGSVLRPASFCGVCGFKPTWGVILYIGVLPFAPSLDTVGFFTPTAADMQWLWSHGFGGRDENALPRLAHMRVRAEPPMERAIADAVARLRAAGIAVDEIDPPARWADLVSAAQLINQYEGARTHRDRYREFGERLGVKLAALVRAGLALPDSVYQEAEWTVMEMSQEMEQIFSEYPLILTPAVPGSAPAGLASTGDPSHNAPWTALQVPAISIPMPVEGPPLGLQITAPLARDAALVAAAALIENIIGGCG
jgi:Asp-tRNA(Asn)/Glu-tRNA(Gln) amidotransferase A subunit family amidase